jgi:hypothetical protein
MEGRTDLIISIGPKKLVLKSFSVSFISESSMGPVKPIPALLINISIDFSFKNI